MECYTWWEGTTYFHWVQSERVVESIKLLSDMMRPTIPIEEFDTEKKVILEEITMYKGRPDFIISDELIQSAFAGHPLGQSILGTEKSIGRMERDEMTAYFDRQYSPDNLTFIVTGRFDREEIIQTVTDCCGTWESNPTDREQGRPPSRLDRGSS